MQNSWVEEYLHTYMHVSYINICIYIQLDLSVFWIQSVSRLQHECHTCWVLVNNQEQWWMIAGVFWDILGSLSLNNNLWRGVMYPSGGLLFKSYDFRDYRSGLAIKSTGARVDSLHPHSGSQPSITPASRILIPLCGFYEYSSHMVHWHAGRLK